MGLLEETATAFFASSVDYSDLNAAKPNAPRSKPSKALGSGVTMVLLDDVTIFSSVKTFTAYRSLSKNSIF